MRYSSNPRGNAATGESQTWVDEAFREVLGDDLGSLRSEGLPETLELGEARRFQKELAERFHMDPIPGGETRLRWIPPRGSAAGGRRRIEDEPVTDFLAHRAGLLCPDALAALERVRIIGSVEQVQYAGQIERFEGLRATIRLKIGALQEELSGHAAGERVEGLFDDLLGEGAIRELREIALPDRTLTGTDAQRVRSALHTLDADVRCLREAWDAVGEDDLVVGLHRVRTSIGSFRSGLDRCDEALRQVNLEPGDLVLIPMPGLESWTPEGYRREDARADTDTFVSVDGFLDRCRDDAELWDAQVRAAGAAGARDIRGDVEELREDMERAAAALDQLTREAGGGAARGRKRNGESPSRSEPVHTALRVWVTLFRLALAETHRGIRQVIRSLEGSDPPPLGSNHSHHDGESTTE